MISPGDPQVHGHRDLADLLRQQITTGQLSPGQALPTERALRETYGLGKHTVREAIAALRHEGLVVTRRGYGAVVRESVAREDIVLCPGSTLISRMPTPEERAQLDISDGIPVLHVVRKDGTGDIYPADRVRIVPAPVHYP